MSVTKVNYTFQEINSLAETVSTKIKNSKIKFDVILCLGRGAMIPSRLISEYAGIHDIEYINIKCYNHENKITRVDCENKDLDFYYRLNGKNILLVDDVFDSGTTINYIMKEIAINVDMTKTRIHSATLFQNKVKKPNNLIQDATLYPSVKQATYYANLYSSDEQWIVFPWELT